MYIKYQRAPLTTPGALRKYDVNVTQDALICVYFEFYRARDKRSPRVFLKKKKKKKKARLSHSNLLDEATILISN